MERTEFTNLNLDHYVPKKVELSTLKQYNDNTMNMSFIKLVFSRLKLQPAFRLTTVYIWLTDESHHFNSQIVRLRNMNEF